MTSSRRASLLRNAPSTTGPVDEAGTVRILGITFFAGTIEEAVDRGLAGGLVTVPAAPALVDIVDDAAYREALERSDTVLTDSGFMVLLWRWAGHGTLPRVSGLAYLRELLTREAMRREGATFWVVPDERMRDRQRAWLNGRGIRCVESQFYVAPMYRAGAVEDPNLLARLNELRPEQVLVGIGGGRQEQLGWYLRSNLDYTPGIHCTGAAIAFLTGDQVRIPGWADRMFLGWLFRIVAAPARFVPRYVKAFGLAPLIFRYGSRSPAARPPDAAGS